MKPKKKLYNSSAWRELPAIIRRELMALMGRPRRPKFTKTRSTSRKRGRKAAKRELINTGRDKQYVRRSSAGQFKEGAEVGRSLAADRRQKAKTKVPSGQGDRGDHG